MQLAFLSPYLQYKLISGGFGLTKDAPIELPKQVMWRAGFGQEDKRACLQRIVVVI